MLGLIEVIGASELKLESEAGRFFCFSKVSRAALRNREIQMAIMPASS